MRPISNWSQNSQLRKRLRRNASPAEIRLWGFLRKRQLMGYKFRRQHGLGPYVVDFYCPELFLAIEIDGNTHYTPFAQAYDKRRERWLNKFGVSLIRFRNDEVLQDVEGVLRRLRSAISTPNPSS